MAITLHTEPVETLPEQTDLVEGRYRDEFQLAVDKDVQTLKTATEKGETGLGENGIGIRVRPEHIHQSLRELAGIGDHPLSKKFPLGLADDQKLQGLWG